MKKYIASILALVSVLLSACGVRQPDPSGSGSSSPENPDAVTHRLLADWYGYVARCEYLYGDMLWALSYLEPFFEDHSWDSLQTARAALYLAKLRAGHIEPPEAIQMSFEDYDSLMQSGADVGAVQMAVGSISSLKSALFVDYSLYQNYLNSPGDAFFLSYQLSCFEDWASLIRQLYTLHLRSCAIETDYVLLEVDGQEEEARFVEAIAEKCPQINALRAGNPQEQEALRKEQTALLDEMEQLTNALSANVGQSQANLDLFQDALTLDISGGMDALSQYVASMAADAVELQGFPSALPYPDWWYVKEDGEIMYTWEEDAHEKQSPLMPGEAIETPPDQYHIKWPDVSLEEYQAYLDSLDGYGIPAEFVTQEEGTYTAFFQLQSGSFAFIWEENAVSFFTMEGSACFAAPWYVLYIRQAAS